MHCIWIAKCHGCPNAVWITTPDDSIKTAIRGWNRYANGGWRKQNEKNNTHHTRHHRHMHGARRMRKRVGAFRASA